VKTSAPLDLSIGNFCFDGTNSDLDRDIGVFLQTGLFFQARQALATYAARAAELRLA